MTPLKNLNAFFSRNDAFRVKVAPNRPREQCDVLTDNCLEAKLLVKGEPQN